MIQIKREIFKKITPYIEKIINKKFLEIGFKNDLNNFIDIGKNEIIQAKKENFKLEEEKFYFKINANKKKKISIKKIIFFGGISVALIAFLKKLAEYFLFNFFYSMGDGLYQKKNLKESAKFYEFALKIKKNLNVQKNLLLIYKKIHEIEKKSSDGIKKK